EQRTDVPTPLPARPARWARRVLAAAAIVALVVAIGIALRSDPGAGVSAAPMRTRDGAVVGRANLQGDPVSLVVDMHGWTKVVGSSPGAGTGVARLTVRGRDGSREVVPLRAHGPSWRETWRLHRMLTSSAVTSVEIRGPDGVLWCSARFA